MAEFFGNAQIIMTILAGVVIFIGFFVTCEYESLKFVPLILSIAFFCLLMAVAADNIQDKVADVDTLASKNKELIKELSKYPAPVIVDTFFVSPEAIIIVEE
jgi:low affinity Fe/Cu permease